MSMKTIWILCNRRKTVWAWTKILSIKLMWICHHQECAHHIFSRIPNLRILNYLFFIVFFMKIIGFFNEYNCSYVSIFLHTILILKQEFNLRRSNFVKHFRIRRFGIRENMWWALYSSRKKVRVDRQIIIQLATKLYRVSNPILGAKNKQKQTNEYCNFLFLGKLGRQGSSEILQIN